MSYDKNVKRMTSMHICLHISLYGYFLIKLQLYFHTTVNLYVNKSIISVSLLAFLGVLFI